MESGVRRNDFKLPSLLPLPFTYDSHSAKATYLATHLWRCGAAPAEPGARRRKSAPATKKKGGALFVASNPDGVAAFPLGHPMSRDCERV